MATFKTIHTSYGLQRLAQAEATGTPINLVAMAVGDGNGNDVNPYEGQTQLVREIAASRHAPNRIYQDAANPSMFTAELVIPASVSGFTMREIGIFDDAGGLFAVGNLPATYKPMTSEGAFSDTVVRMQFVVTNANIVTIMVDPNVAVATQAWVMNQPAPYPGGLTGQVLKKDSNADGDASWHDPTTVNVVVNTVEEKQTLAAGQAVVDLALTNTIGLAVYVEGVRLVRGTEWTPHATIMTRLTLAQSYPAGTVIVAAQNEPASQLEAALQQDQNLADLQDAATARANLGVYSKAESDRLISAGAVVHFARSTAPQGWLKANGAAVSRTAYAALYAAIGTTFGSGDGFNTFNLPDLRGEFLRGWDDSRGIDLNRALGSSQAGQNQAHTHNASTSTDGGHTHQYTDTDTDYTGQSGLQPGSSGFVDRETSRQTSRNGDHSHAVTVLSSGGNEARPRNVAMLACIKF